MCRSGAPTVLIGDLLANQSTDIDPHLFVRLKSLLQIVALRSLIISVPSIAWNCGTLRGFEGGVFYGVGDGVLDYDFVAAVVGDVVVEELGWRGV